MSKKDDLPAMPFYVGDWLKAPEIRALSYSAKGLWLEMLCYMWESKERGYLLIGDRPVSKETLSKMTGLAKDLLEDLLSELEQFAVYSIREDGAIYSRKMIKMQHIREVRAAAGKEGGFAKAKSQQTPGKSMSNTEYENEIEIEHEVVFKKNNNRTLKRPTLEECIAYCAEKAPTVDATHYFNSREANGWIMGNGQPIKNWKAHIQTWERINKQKKEGSNVPTKKYLNANS